MASLQLIGDTVEIITANHRTNVTFEDGYIHGWAAQSLLNLKNASNVVVAKRTWTTQFLIGFFVGRYDACCDFHVFDDTKEVAQ
jgi:hypothetical protein